MLWYDQLYIFIKIKNIFYYVISNGIFFRHFVRKQYGTMYIFENTLCFLNHNYKIIFSAPFFDTHKISIARK